MKSMKYHHETDLFVVLYCIKSESILRFFGLHNSGWRWAWIPLMWLIWWRKWTPTPPDWFRPCLNTGYCCTACCLVHRIDNGCSSIGRRHQQPWKALQVSQATSILHEPGKSTWWQSDWFSVRNHYHRIPEMWRDLIGLVRHRLTPP